MLKDRDAVGPTAASPGAPICGGASSGAEPTLCGGCGARITDRYYLLAVDRQWHSACLKCSQCKLPLDSELTCFARDGNIYCKEDYYRLFAVKRCARCQAGISSSELVMRARDLVFHLHCFTCASCGTALAKGDHFGLRDGIIYCRPHYELLYASSHLGFPPCPAATAEAQYFAAVAAAAAATAGASGGAATPGPGAQGAALNSNGAAVSSNGADGSSAAAAAVAAAAAIAAAAAVVQKGRPRKRKLPSVVEVNELPLGMRHPSGSLELLHPGDLSSSMDSLSYETSVSSPTGPPGHHQRTKRMRTSFKHHQLRTMKSYFAINQNPDAKDLKQLAQKTGLSKRVLQVWFQNARAKWRRNLMRQESGILNSGTNNTVNGSVVPSGNSGNPSIGGSTSASVLLGDSNGSLSTPSGTEDLTPQTHHHPHQHSTVTAAAAQTLVFGDLY